MTDTGSFPSPAVKILTLASLLALSLFATVFGFTSGRTMRSRPDWFYLADEVPSDRQAMALDWLFGLGAVASVLSAIGLFVKLFNNGGGGRAPRDSAANEQPAAGSSRPIARSASFGKRSR